VKNFKDKLEKFQKFCIILKAIVLWPDGTNYRNPEIPQCLLRPRYLYVPPIATGFFYIGIGTVTV
jgi:hypothetical protein